MLDHNLCVVSVAGGRNSRSDQRRPRRNCAKAKLDWVYPEELQITTAYWWAPDSSVDRLSGNGRAAGGEIPDSEFARRATAKRNGSDIPPAGSANPIVKVFVRRCAGRRRRARWTPATNSDIYIPRVNWLPDSPPTGDRAAESRAGHARSARSPMPNPARRASSSPRRINIGSTSATICNSCATASASSGPANAPATAIFISTILTASKSRSSPTAIGKSPGSAESMKTRRPSISPRRRKAPLERHLYRVGLRWRGIRPRHARCRHARHQHVARPPTHISTRTRTAAHPPRQDLYSRRTATKIAALNENNSSGAGRIRAVPVEFLTVKTHDNILLNAMMIKPPDFDAIAKISGDRLSPTAARTRKSCEMPGAAPFFCGTK